ncbi:MAG: hypothetical protein QXL47_02310 [Candidatus Anstonellales archaeon]
MRPLSMLVNVATVLLVLFLILEFFYEITLAKEIIFALSVLILVDLVARFYAAKNKLSFLKLNFFEILSFLPFLEGLRMLRIESTILRLARPVMNIVNILSSLSSLRWMK